MENKYKDKKVLIFGLGLNDGGLGMAEFFLEQGAIVTITDGKTEEELKDTLSKLERYKDRVTLHLGGHIEDDFINNDIIVRNPAIKPDNEWLDIARKNNKEIVMEMALFHQLAPCPIIGITGTKGKSTTTTLVYEFLKSKYGDRVLLGGNIGKSAIRELPNLTEDNIAVLELSSFQLDAMGESHISPNTSLITNIYTDHINWHGSMEEYINAKKNIFKYQKEDEYVVLNIDNDITKSFLKDISSNVITYSLEDPSATYYMDSNMKIFKDGTEVLEIKDLILDGKHNMYNILGAYSLSQIYDIPNENVLNVLKSFKGVEGREELIREIEGIRIYNDTTATSIEAMLSMFERFGEKNKGKIVMISGGVDKGLEYSKVSEYINKYCKALILLEGTASEKIKEYINDIPVYSYYNDLKDAIDKAYEVSNTGDMIILCPAAASFNMFANEFDRGKQFVNYVNTLNAK